MVSLKPLYDNQKKVEYEPIDINNDGSWYLFQLYYDRQAKEIPTELSIDFGTCYCYANGDVKLLVTMCSTIWSTECSHFLMSEGSDGKWKNDPEKKKACDAKGEVFLENKGRSIIYVAGHEGLEALVTHFSGKWIYSKGLIKSKDPAQVQAALMAMASDDWDESQTKNIFTGEVYELTDYSSVPVNRRKKRLLPTLCDDETGEIIPDSELKENNILALPLVLKHGNLPTVKFSKGSRAKTPAQKYDDNLAVILEKSGCDSFEALIKASLDNPHRIRMHYAMLGIPYALSADEYESSIKAEALLVATENGLSEEG